MSRLSEAVLDALFAVRRIDDGSPCLCCCDPRLSQSDFHDDGDSCSCRRTAEERRRVVGESARFIVGTIRDHLGRESCVVHSSGLVAVREALRATGATPAELRFCPACGGRIGG